MKFSRLRTLLSFGFLGCATMAVVPLGCGATVRQLAQQDDRPRVPDATAERLRECVDEFGGDLHRGYYTFDYTVTVDEEGRVVDVASKGVPHADLAACTRIALRGMTIPEELLGLRKLRLSESTAPANGQTPAERGLVGNPGVLVAVAIALADLIIEVGPVIIVMAAELELSKDIAVTVREKEEWEKECGKHLNACLDSSRQSDPGSVYGSKRCLMCHEKCKAEQEWPKGVRFTNGRWASCVYKSN
ncbi:hypothetical protein [Polyangium jinanense]|uniref:Uncharacterized protein n=1 Tax=Polyangium jinanense TaxID=2829994 RepID=A0A9X3XHT3_9BACT|nr:hypothetical protein [Polyangium jinanense]MDC3958379.1 hypothetical protein [Polyangium jinanense]MDC3988291.1 hypothetical protein [Polyangium jinanense]